MRFLILLFIFGCATKEKKPVQIIEPDVSVEPKKELKVCLTGDTGTGKDEQYKVSKAMEKSGCKHVFIAGDLIYEMGIKRKFLGKSMSSKSWDRLDEKFIQPYKPMMDKGVMFYPIAGNHDEMGRPDLWWEEVIHEYDQIHYPDRHYAVRIDNFCAIAFNPYRSEYVEELKQKLPDFLEKLGPSKCDVSMVMNHFPYYSAGSHGDATGYRKELFEELFLGKFDIFLAGHDHLLVYSGETDGTHHVLSGAGGKLRDIEKTPREFAAAELGFVLMTIKGKEVELEYMNVDSNVLYAKKFNAQGIR